MSDPLSKAANGGDLGTPLAGLSNFCVLRAQPEEIVEKFFGWHDPLLREFGSCLTKTSGVGSLDKVLRWRLPRVAPVVTKWVILGTKTGWSVLFDNLRWGTDAGYHEIMSGLLKSRGIYVICCADQGRALTKIYGGYCLSVADYGQVTRSIYCLNDGGRWRFELWGEPLPFEQPEAYSAKRVRDRFGPDLLKSYLASLDIHLFDPDWYVSTREVPSFLISRIGYLPPNLREYPNVGDL